MRSRTRESGPAEPASAIDSSEATDGMEGSSTNTERHAIGPTFDAIGTTARRRRELLECWRYWREVA